jgi:RNA polymerase sigma factor (sigma-70 family)
MQGTEGANVEFSSMFAAARRMTRKYGYIGYFDPDDVAQNAMIKSLNRTGERQPTIGWLYKTVRSSAADAGRICARERAIVGRIIGSSTSCVREQIDDLGSTYLDSRLEAIGEDEEDPDLFEQLTAMLKQLTTPLREVLLLYASGRSYEDIAAITGAKVGTVRSRLHYARLRAREIMRDVA